MTSRNFEHFRPPPPPIAKLFITEALISVVTISLTPLKTVTSFMDNLLRAIPIISDTFCHFRFPPPRPLLLSEKFCFQNMLLDLFNLSNKLKRKLLYIKILLVSYLQKLKIIVSQNMAYFKKDLGTLPQIIGWASHR
jgi:hypothetical protein